MNTFYYDVTYMKTAEDKLRSSDTLLIRSEKLLDHESAKRFVRFCLNKPSAVITIVRSERISKEAFLQRGGDGNPNWFNVGNL